MKDDDLHRNLEIVSDVLRAAERRLHALLYHSSEMIALFSADGIILYASPATTRLLGYADGEFTGRSAFDFVHPDDLRAAREQLAALKTVGSLVAEARIRHRDGSWRVMRGHFVNHLRDPAVAGVVVNYRDVTEERAAAAAHRALQDHAAFGLAAVGAGFWEVDLATNTIRISDSMAAIIGMPVGEYDGTMDAFQRMIHPADRATVNAAIERMLMVDAPYDVQFRLVWPDRSVHWVHAKARVVRGASGAPEKILGVSIDVTERKQLEASLQQTQRLESLGRLAGGIVHDFNNILTTILGMGELLATRLPADDEQAGDMADILAAARTGQQLTQQLLAFSRQQRIDPQLIDLNEAVRRAERLVRMAPGSHIVLKTSLASDPLPVRIDPSQFEQIILNLAANAREAMPESGTICMTTAKTALATDVEAEAFGVVPGEYAKLVFEDTGSGMSPGTLARIFEPFFTTKSTGTGLGLATVYGIVRQSGGYVKVTSEIGRGTTFRIGLPLVT